MRLYDPNAGDISIEEFKAAATQMGANPSEEQLELLISVFDENGDGSVSVSSHVSSAVIAKTHYHCTYSTWSSYSS
jgi:Ca2+-binding EF-hand superfamily protein